ncbi:MAG: hypothetical protein AAGA90_19645 [Actinomycetota bacterium]
MAFTTIEQVRFTEQATTPAAVLADRPVLRMRWIRRSGTMSALWLRRDPAG